MKDLTSQFTDDDFLINHFAIRWWYSWPEWPPKESIKSIEGKMMLPEYPGVYIDIKTAKIEDHRPK